MYEVVQARQASYAGSNGVELDVDENIFQASTCSQGLLHVLTRAG